MKTVKPPAKPAAKKATSAKQRIHTITGNDKALVRSEALERLGITSAQLATAPEITHLLARANGGMPQVYTAMRLAPDEIILQFLKKYDSIAEADREHLPLEAVALAAGINMAHLLGSIQLALQAQAVNAVKIIAVTNHHKITEARVAFGLLPLGERDRTALDTAMGFLPQAKGPTFINKAIFGSGQSAMDQQRTLREPGDDDDGEGENPDDIDLDRLFPPANRMQLKLQEIRNRTPLPKLPPPGK